MKENISFSWVIVQDANTKVYYGMVKEVEGVVVKGVSEDDIKAKIPKAIKAIMNAKRKYSDSTRTVLNSQTFKVSEYEQNYVPC